MLPGIHIDANQFGIICSQYVDGLYTDEELGALILHDILQNVMSDTTKIRFLKAYTAALNRHNNVQVIEM